MMIERLVAAVGRPAALVLFSLASFMTIPLLLLGLVLMFALGLTAAGGLLVGLFCLLFGHFWSGFETLAAGGAAFVVLVLVWDRVFTVRDAARRGDVQADQPIAPCSLRIDFDR